MIRNPLIAALVRPFAGILALIAVLALSACGGGSGAPNNPYQVTVVPGPLTILPAAPTIYSQVAATLTISGGTPPYRAFSSNSAVLPVTQVLPGNTLTLLAGSVSASTPVTVTIQDSAGSTASVDVTILPGPATPPPPLTVLPNPIDIFSTVAAQLAIEGGVPPYRAFSSNPTVLPVAPNVNGSTVNLLASSVTADTVVTVTIEDSVAQTVAVTVNVHPKTSVPATPLAVQPPTLVAFSGVPTSVFVSGGVPPYSAFSSNPTVLPVTQNVAGSAVPLLASPVSSDTPVTLTIQDSAAKTATVAVTVRAATLLNSLTIKPNLADCGTQAICSGQSGTATVTLQLPGGGPAAGRQVRFDVVAGPYTIATNGTSANALSLTVTSDAAGNAQVIIRANVDAPTQPAQIRVTDVISGQQLTGDFLIQQRTSGSTILTVVPTNVTFTAAFKSPEGCIGTSGFRADYFIYGGTPPYRITQTIPTGSILVNSTVSASGGFFEVITNGTCVDPQTFSIVDATGRQITATLSNLPGATEPPAPPEPEPPSALQIVPGSLTVDCTDTTIVDFVISGGTPPYNASASPKVGNSPTITARDNPASGAFSTTPVVNKSGGIFRISNLTQSVTVSFLDSSRPQQPATRTITCSGQSQPLAVAPSSYDYTLVGCPGQTANFVITGGAPPYTIGFVSSANGTISPTTVATSGGGFSVTGMSNNAATTFIKVTDNAGNQQIPSLTCPASGPTQPLTVQPSGYDYTSLGCPGRTANFVITGGAPPYTIGFVSSANGIISPTTVATSGGGFSVTGMSNNAATTFIRVTDTAANQQIPSITCPAL